MTAKELRELIERRGVNGAGFDLGISSFKMSRLLSKYDLDQLPDDHVIDEIQSDSRSDQSDSSSKPKDERSQNKILLIIGFIVLVAVLTNPDLSDHKQELRKLLSQNFQQAVQKSDKPQNEWEQAGTALGMALGGTFIDRIIDSAISRDNYILFSVTVFTWQGETRSIGFGILGNVFLSNQIREHFATLGPG